MLIKRKRFNPSALWLRDGEGDEGKGPNGNPEPKPQPKPEDKPADKPEDKSKSELEAFKQREKDLKAKLAKFEDEEKKRQDANKTNEEKLAAYENDKKALSKQLLVERVRRSGGFNDSIYDDVSPSGETEEEIKASYDSFKNRLDAHFESKNTGKGDHAPGGGTTSSQQKQQQGQNDEKEKKTEWVPTLIRQGLVKKKGSVS